MKQARVFLVLAIVLSVFLSMSAVAGAGSLPVREAARQANGARQTSDEIIIQYKPGASPIQKAVLRNGNGLALKEALPLADTELLKLKPGVRVDAMVARLRSHSQVALIQPNYRYYASTTDTYYSLEWGLENNGQTILNQAGSIDIDIDAPEAWNATTVNGSLVVAVIDTGIDISHPDLAGSIWTNPGEIAGNRKDDDGNGYVDDVHGWNFYGNNNRVYSAKDGDDHGTHVAGTIAATANNGIGIAGVAPGVKIMPLKFLGPTGGASADAVKAIVYAGKMGASLANNSWGGDGYDDILSQAVVAFDKPFVVAAGNNNRNTDSAPSYPSAFTAGNVISVAAIDNRGTLASFSNYGATSVDFGAPGVSIASTTPGNTYSYMDGTSMAAPHVSGIVALMLSANAKLTGTQVRSLLTGSTVPLASLAGKTVSGGLVNAAKAVEAAKAAGTTQPPTDPGPLLVDVSPANKSTGVALNTQIVFTFKEEIKAGAAFNSITFKKGSVAVAFTVEINGNQVIITPKNPLLKKSTYTVTLPAGAVTDMAGNPTKASSSTSFTTLR